MNAAFYMSGVIESQLTMAEVVEDEEPHPTLQAPCPCCSGGAGNGDANQRTFVLYHFQAEEDFGCNDCNLGCRHCGMIYEAHSPDYCVLHDGKHELAINACNRLAFGYGLSDIRGMYQESSVSLHIFPGHWTCCKALSFHDHLGCPLLVSSSKELAKFCTWGHLVQSYTANHHDEAGDQDAHQYLNNY